MLFLFGGIMVEVVNWICKFGLCFLRRVGLFFGFFLWFERFWLSEFCRVVGFCVFLVIFEWELSYCVCWFWCVVIVVYIGRIVCFFFDLVVLRCLWFWNWWDEFWYFYDGNFFFMFLDFSCRIWLWCNCML